MPIEKSAAVHHGQRREQIVQRIIDEIVQGKIPPASRLITQELEKRFDVSATPIREALAELAGVGIVDLIPNRGAVVHTFTRREVRDILRVRRALECEAVTHACGHVPPNKLALLRSELQQLAQQKKRGKSYIAKAQLLDNRLHDLIARYCRNKFLARELSRLALLFRTFRDTSWKEAKPQQESNRLSEEANEHLQIVDAMIANDRQAARRAMSMHINSSVRYWTATIRHPDKTS